MKRVATPSLIQFDAVLHRPANVAQDQSWMFLRLPMEASCQLPSRSMVSVEGTFQGLPLHATLEPDGEGGHWLKVGQELQQRAKVEAGDVVSLSIAPAASEPEPDVPHDLQAALDTAPPKALETWHSITPLARRDYIHWITSGKKAETRTKRIEVACSKLSAGNRRPCCFDRSGQYSKSMSCPLPAED